MTLKIEIFGTADHGPLDQQIEEAMAAIGFHRISHAGRVILDKYVEPLSDEVVAAEMAKMSKFPEQPEEPAAEPAKRTRKKKADEPATQQSISTGGERVNPEDDQSVQDQDKADEQAEVEANREGDKVYTLDDVKNSFGLYVQKFGMPAVTEDGVNILSDALAGEKLPEGEKFWKATIIPEARYGDVIAAFKAAASASERYKRRGA